MNWTARRRKVVYIIFYEFFAIVLCAIFLRVLTGNEKESSLALAIIMSIIAVCWNYFFNTCFEWVEDRYHLTRTVLVRSLHSILFEAGLMIFCIPLYMYWYSLSFLLAFQMEVGLLIFFLGYTYVFTWIFDHLIPRVAEEKALV